MLTRNQLRQAVGCDAYGIDGQRIGTVGPLFLDDHSGAPEFVTIDIGSEQVLVPVSGAEFDVRRLVVAWSVDRIVTAPSVDPDRLELSDDEEMSLYRHYGLPALVTSGSASPPMLTPDLYID